MKKTAEMEIIWNCLMNGLRNKFGVAGVMGNLYAESSLKPNNLQNTGNKALGLTDAQYTKAVDDETITKSSFCRDGYGYGIAQWSSRNRKEGLYTFAKMPKVSIADPYIQAHYLYSELLSSYPALQKTLMIVPNDDEGLRTATEWFMKKFERPADQSEKALNKRIKYAKDILNLFTESKEESTVSEPVKRYVRVNSKSVNIRKGPTAKHAAITLALKGDSFPYIRKSEETGWYEIRLIDGSTGWVTNRYTSIFEG